MHWIFGVLATVTFLSWIVVYIDRSSLLIQIFRTFFIWNILIAHVGVIVSICYLGFGVKIRTLMLADVINLIIITRSPIRITRTVTWSWINLATILVRVYHIRLVLYTYLVFHKIDHAVFIKFWGRWMVSSSRRILCSLVHCHSFHCTIIQQITLI